VSLNLMLYPRRIARSVGVAILLAAGAGPLSASAVSRDGMRSDSTDVVAAVHRYHAALASGDSVAVAALLAPGAVILESGGVETRAQYLGGHLRGDIAFAQGVPSERGAVAVTVRGDVAWAASTSTTKGEYRGRAVNSVGAELMVLVRTGQGWQIAAIHWSSRSRPTGGN